MIPIHAVCIISKNTKDNLALSELFIQGKITIKNRKKYLQKEKCIVKNEIFSLGINESNNNISKIKDDLINQGSVLYIVGHHEKYGRIGASGEDGFTPEELADNLAKELGDNIKEIKCIQFYVCNSAYSNDGYEENSYCGKFYNYMREKYNNNNLIVGGFIGFLFEDPKHKHTYITQTYDDYKKKTRAESQMIYFNEIK